MSVTTLARGVLALALLAGNVAWAQPQPSSGDKARLDLFEKQVESVRGRLKIPGLSVAIVKDQELFTLPSKTELLAATESRFFLKARPYEFVFTKSEGQPAQTEIVEGGETYRSKRIQ